MPDEDDNHEITADELIKGKKQDNSGINQKIQPKSQDDDYISGRIDGEQQAKGKFIYFLFGLLFSIIGILIAAFYKESPNPYLFEGKSKAYILGFTEAYQGKSRSTNVVSCIVCFIWFVVMYAFFSPIKLQF
jgi:hypothetical protein